MKRNRRDKKYYAVAGTNACGVYDNYDKILESQRFITKFKCKRFDNFADAKSEAESYYIDLQEPYSCYEIPEIKKVNWLYYRKSM